MTGKAGSDIHPMALAFLSSGQQTYRAIGNTTVTGEYVTLEWDMTDRPHWDNTLKQFRFDLE